MTKKTTYLTGLLTASTILVASAQSTLYTTTQDFSQFASWYNGSPVATTSTLYYSDASTVNGIGNTTAAGGVGTPGSLQVTLQGWGNPNGSYAKFPTPDAALAAIAPGSSWATGVTASSGTFSFDLYCPAGFTGGYQGFGMSLGYWDNNWTQTQWHDDASFSYSSFTGADGNTWRHYSVAYTTTATAVSGQLQDLELGVFMNIDGADAGKLAYIDNIQVQAVPEPGTMALAAMGGAALLFWRSRTVR
jgi:hypothetical protein